MIKDFAFLVYTNENYLPIADLTMGEFDRWFPKNTFKRYLVSNKFTDYKFQNTNFIPLESFTKFDGSGNHFGETLSKALIKIEEKYLFFLCDDYLVINHPDLESLKDLLKIIIDYDVDFFSFASMNPNQEWKIFNKETNLLTEIDLFYIPNNYQYKHSVQPCIWKKSSLLEILKYNPNLPIHYLDTTNIMNKNGMNREFLTEESIWNDYPDGEDYKFKCICTNFKAYDELEDYKYFVFPYVEIIRHGFFNFWQETNTKRFLKKFIKDNNIQNNQYLSKFIP